MYIVFIMPGLGGEDRGREPGSEGGGKSTGGRRREGENQDSEGVGTGKNSNFFATSKKQLLHKSI